VKRVANFSVAKESIEDMCRAKRYNPCLKLTFRDKSGIQTHKISAGYSDDITVYREHGETFVLSENFGLGYVGLEVFNGGEKTGDIFLESHHVKEVLGKQGLAAFTIIRRLLQYISQ